MTSFSLTDHTEIALLVDDFFRALDERPFTDDRAPAASSPRTRGR
ncbi:hypothetical protein [Streptomyces sp. NPDC005805]